MDMQSKLTAANKSLFQVAKGMKGEGDWKGQVEGKPLKDTVNIGTKLLDSGGIGKMVKDRADAVKKLVEEAATLLDALDNHSACLEFQEAQGLLGIAEVTKLEAMTCKYYNMEGLLKRKKYLEASNKCLQEHPWAEKQHKTRESREQAVLRAMQPTLSAHLATVLGLPVAQNPGSRAAKKKEK